MGIRVYWVIPDLLAIPPDRTIKQQGSRLARLSKKVNIRVDVVCALPQTPMHSVANRLRRHGVARSVRGLDAPHTIGGVGWVIPISEWVPPLGCEGVYMAPWTIMVLNQHNQLITLIPPL